MAGYKIRVEEDVSTAVVDLSDGDQVFILVDLALTLAADPHGHGDIWMTLADAVWRVLEIGESARLVFVVDDTARTVTLMSLTLKGG